MASSSLIEGSSPKTSSPTLASIIAVNMPAPGRVTVSERKSIGVAFGGIGCAGIVCAGIVFCVIAFVYPLQNKPI